MSSEDWLKEMIGLFSQVDKDINGKRNSSMQIFEKLLKRS